VAGPAALQEKNKLITDIKQLKTHYAKYEPTILELKKKYEVAMKEKMLMSIERDKAEARVSPVTQEPAVRCSPGGKAKAATVAAKQRITCHCSCNAPVLLPPTTPAKPC
jgi:hypothetical protein